MVSMHEIITLVYNWKVWEGKEVWKKYTSYGNKTENFAFLLC